VFDFGGLTLLPVNPRAAFIAGLASIAAVTTYIIALDLVWPHPAYTTFYASPLWPRVPLMAALSLTEELKFRLILMTAMVWLFSLVRKPVPPVWIMVAIIVSQLVNFAPFMPVNPIYGSLRYWLVGCVWGWLYWRHGFVTAMVAHPLCHFLLDPVLFVLWS
jgi:hypothetical protein